MDNKARLEMEIKGITLSPDEITVYLAENGLNANDTYNATDKAQTRMIYETALSILESIANQPQLMKNYTSDDQTVSQFHENLMARIDQLENKIRKMKSEESKAANTNGSFFMLFTE
ncbi:MULTISPECIES: hypothetical protein [Brevibacillus]|uniref:hypothetical protein n=1 Tax=Brevibacillus TaxID=55080 RepID=UPI00245412CA|nr:MULTISPECIES: hypothetical protein [Brevibacillus]MDH4619961.1 hypothetical protein [Brevibacillus sp. AY1]MED1951820.1 hypothetical protein [Brevibacillus centrosporus]